MNTEEFKRRLTAILSADVEGYSRLMRDDEEATIRTLTTYRTAMTNLIQQYRGRVVDSPGDNLLAEFASVVDAVNCAVEIQREFAERNAELPDSRKMQFRIGVNLGDVIEEGERIYGDGINIAARMEGLAEGGGICISGTVYDAIEKKIGLEHEYLGEQEIKNIDKPVRAFRVLSFPGAAAHRVIKAKKEVGKTWRKTVLAIAALLVIAVGAWAIWNYGFRAAPPPEKVISKEPSQTQLPEKPSIAVLPFVNISGDPEQEYFSDGITEDLITDLSKISGLLVSSRNSTFAYKGKFVKPEEIAKELGVRYLLEGSVRKVGEEVRINAQLINTSTGHHLWADRYDGRLQDIFQLQDKINRKIITSLTVKLAQADREHLDRKETDNIQAYDALLKALDLMHRYTPDNFANALSHLEVAVKLDPNYARAYAMMADIYRWVGMPKRLGIDLVEARLRSRYYLRMALKNPTSTAYRLAALSLYRYDRDFEKALEASELAVALEPNYFKNYFAAALALICLERPEESFELIDTSLRIDPGCLF